MIQDHTPDETAALAIDSAYLARQECERLQVINAELLAACKLVVDYDENDDDGVTMMLNYADALEKCRAAIRKATP